ncbi:MAG: metallophosphoesterase [Ignavibacteria bacterium]|nr:metallophosphoesterase [Ignavibacteria bacterium]
MKILRTPIYIIVLAVAFFIVTANSQFVSGAEINIFYSPVYEKNRGEQTDKDSSSLGSDGPIIIYDNGSIISYSIIPGSADYKITKKEIKKTDTMTCNIDETKHRFSFQLKDSINIEKDEYEMPGKMFIISDIEGNFKGFEMILNAAGVINKNFQWTFGSGHLVLNGDLFDRAVNVTECLWLIYKLENEAERRGGKVHFILGNHEMMNLRGNYKYVRNKYIEDAKALNLEYNKWYAPDTELGKWLRSKNGIEKIGDFIFVHGGISKDFPKDKYTISEINDNIRMCIDKVFPAGEASKDIFIGSRGPLWYRDVVNEKETQEEVEQTLKSFNASKMIMGHTILDKMKYLYEWKAIAIDIEHQINSDNGKMYGLYFERGEFFIIDNNGIKVSLE